MAPDCFLRLCLYLFARHRFGGGDAHNIAGKARDGRLFARHDRNLLLEMSQYWGDDLEYRQQVRERAGHIDQLLRRDLNVFGAGDPDESAWDTKTLEEEIRRDTMPA